MSDLSDDVVGLLTIGNTEVALPLATLREVVPCPQSFASLPVRAEGLLGAMELRGSIVPVVDIRSLIGEELSSGSEQIIVVMTDGKYIVGLLADRLRSVQRVSQERIVTVDDSNGPLFFTATFLHPENNSVVSLLSIEAILSVPGIPLVADNMTAALRDEELERRSLVDVDAQRYTMVRCGDYAFAFDIDTVHTTIPSWKAQRSVLQNELCRGVIAYAGFDVPVIDPLTLFGLGDLAEEDGPGLVVKLDSGFVVFALSELVELKQLGAVSIDTLPAFSVRRPELFDGMYRSESDLFFVINGSSLLNDSEIRAHAAMNTDAVRTGGVSESVSEGSLTDHNKSLLTFSIGIQAAVPLAQVNEILPLPDDVTATNSDEHILGMMAHRAGVIPVVSLRRVFGRPSAEATSASCLLLVGSPDSQVALLVDSLDTIADQAWIDPDAKTFTLEDINDAAASLEASPLVQIRGNSDLIPKVDLGVLVSLLQNPSIEQLDPVLASSTDETVQV